MVSYARARISRRSIGLISPLALAGLILVIVIAPGSPPSITAAVGLFVLALGYVLCRGLDEIKANQADTAERARLHREQLAEQLLGGVSHEAQSLLGKQGHMVDRWEHAADALKRAYGKTSGPPSDGLSRSRLRAVHDRGTSSA